jgi:hypothetical protein
MISSTRVPSGETLAGKMRSILTWMAIAIIAFTLTGEKEEAN